MVKGKYKSSYIYDCLFCSKVLVDKKSLEYHIRTHTGEKPNFCKTCSYEGTCDIYMRKHEKISCQKLSKCSHCGSTFREYRDLAEHRSFHCTKLPFKCRFCPKTFPIQAGLTHHLHIHRDVGLILTPREKRTCVFCNKLHLTEQSLIAHVLQHIQERPFACRLCDYSATTEYMLKTHQNAVHAAEKGVECPSCGKMFTTEKHLKMHQKRRHDKPEVLINCTMCKYSSYHRNDFKAHLRSHTNEKHFKCDVCKKELTTKAGLRNHRLTHFPDQKKIYSCSVCDKTFGCSNSLYSHKKAHSDLRPFLCKFCAKTFKTKSSLNIHMDIHTRGIIVKCRACPVTLASRAERHEHELQFHANENPQMRCDLCRKPIRKFDFQDHLDSHNKAKRHWCIFCDKNFLKPGELAEHTRGHIREFPSWCHDCGHEFKRDRPNVMKKHKCSKQ